MTVYKFIIVLHSDCLTWKMLFLYFRKNILENIITYKNLKGNSNILQYIFHMYIYIYIYIYKSWRQHSTKEQLYGHLPPITKTIKIRWTRHAGHCWRSRDELITDVLLWTPSHGRAKVGQQAWTYIQQLCVDMGCSPEDLLEAMDNREGWRESIRNIRAHGAVWWYMLWLLEL